MAAAGSRRCVFAAVLPRRTEWQRNTATGPLDAAAVPTQSRARFIGVERELLNDRVGGELKP
jgi:hypothetical protein